MHKASKALILVIGVLGAGCAVNPDRHFRDHAIEVNGNGSIEKAEEVSIITDGARVKKSELRFIGESTEFTPQIARMFNHAAKSGRNVFIFFHGGLDTINDSRKRTNLLIQRYDKDATTELDGYYPIMFNWDSGLGHSYLEHLFSVREGEKAITKTQKVVAALTSPIYFAIDIGRGILRTPIDVWYTLQYNLESSSHVRDWLSHDSKNANLLYGEIKKQRLGHASRGASRKVNWGTPLTAAYNVITFPIQLALSPLVDGIGTPAWENMERRTRNLDNRPGEFDVANDRQKAEEVLARPPVALMTVFANQLEKFACAHPNVKITLIAHSMGAFIVNDVVRRTPHVDYSAIIYMAGADSIRDTHDAIVPYLKLHRKTKFFMLTLHPQAEVAEIEGAGLAPRGSLLVWIDDFFSTALTYNDKTVGRWDNVIQAYPEFKDVQDQVYIKAFDQTSLIQKHGNLGQACFWQNRFWKLGPDDHDPWQATFYDVGGLNACRRHF